MTLVECRLYCTFCQAIHTIAFPSEDPIREALLATSCPTCFRTGSMRLARPLPIPPPASIGRYDEPRDELDDDELLERRIRTRSMH